MSAHTMTLEKFCAGIDMPPCVTARLCGDPSDANGLRDLRQKAERACAAHKSYVRAGIDDEIYYATMGCFSRFVREYKAAYGEYGFDRGWWVDRQISLRLFRLGTLEYELAEYRGKPAVSVHIPSDADLSDAVVSQSLRSAERFFSARFPTYAGAEYFCASWLLSPALRNLLPPDSKILHFAARFTAEHVDCDATDYVRWVYKIPDLPPERFAEDTTLQRNIKRYVLAGGKIGNATGLLKRDN